MQDTFFSYVILVKLTFSSEMLKMFNSDWGIWFKKKDNNNNNMFVISIYIS